MLGFYLDFFLVLMTYFYRDIRDPFQVSSCTYEEKVSNSITLFVCTILGYRISAYSFRGNYSFLNLTLCTVTFGNSTYRCGNYSREETIQGRKLYEEIRYIIFAKVR